jgi:outer membrane protein insertion porin family/translocation and assembly module TamA
MVRSLLGGSLAASIALALLASPAAADESEPVVGKVRFSGVSAVEKKELAAAILTASARWQPWVDDPVFDEDALGNDLERIVAFYRDRGYYDAKAEYELDWNEDRTRVNVRIRIQEGSPVHLREWRIDLPDGVLSDEERNALLQGLPLEEGSVFGVIPYRNARQQLVQGLANLGRPAAQIEGGADVDLESHSARLAWKVAPGPLVRFGEARVEGLERVDEKLVTRELRFREGQRYSLDLLRESQRNIYELGLFRGVTIQPERSDTEGETSPDAETVWPIAVRLEEASPRRVRVRVGYGTEDKFRAQVSWTHRNFFGGARRFDIGARYSSLVQGGAARFEQPRFLEPRLRLEVTASGLRETMPAYEAVRAGGRVLLLRPIAKRWEARLGYDYEWGDLEDDPFQPDLWRLGTVLSGVSWSSLDDPVEPRKGSWANFSVDTTAEALGSNTDFVTLSAEGRLFVPVWRAVLANRVRLGSIEPFSGRGFVDVPRFRRFFAGGAQSVRGFKFQSLGPRDPNGDPTGGLTLATASVEARVPLWRWFTGVAFFDVGQIHPDSFHLSSDLFYYSVGPGLRVRTPIGSLGLDYGFALRRPTGADSGRLHFSVGHTF